MLAFANGGYMASIEITLLLLIVALSPSGDRLFGLLAQQAQNFDFLKTSFGAALLMAMPIKTMTALLTAKDPAGYSEIAICATTGLVCIAVGLGLLAGAIPAVSAMRLQIAVALRKLG